MYSRGGPIGGDSGPQAAIRAEEDDRAPLTFAHWENESVVWTHTSVSRRQTQQREQPARCCLSTPPSARPGGDGQTVVGLLSKRWSVYALSLVGRAPSFIIRMNNISDTTFVTF